MKKILYVSEGFITKKDLEDRKIPEMIAEFEKYDAKMDFAEDLGALKGVGGNMRQANLKLEKEGPNWVEHSTEFLDALKDAEIIIIHYSAAGKAFFEAAKNLKLLCVMRSGVENVDMEAANSHGVTVCASPGRAAEPVADFTLTLILCLMRRMGYSMMTGTGKWKKVEMGLEGMMKTSTVGLLGFGVIAQMVAKRLKGFGCDIITFDPWIREGAAEEYGVEVVENIEDLFKKSDYLSVHARLTDQNQGLINKELLSMMKPSAYIVNTARAGLVDEDALIEALENNVIAGAGLDVFQKEPLRDGHPFLTLDNVISTPHMAGNGGDFILRSIESPINEIRRYFTGEAFQFKMN